MPLGKSVRAVSFCRLREQLKAVGKKAGNLSVPVLARAADARAWQKGSVLSKRNGTTRGSMTERDSFLRKVLHHAKANRVIEFIHVGRVIGGFAGRAALEDDEV